MNSDTPRTDAEYWANYPKGNDGWEFARQLERENAELRKDAERYRWLRNQDWFSSPISAVRNPKKAVKLGHDCPSRERLDAAIDAAKENKNERPAVSKDA